jgi:uncharacterized FlgJ-related protein
MSVVYDQIIYDTAVEQGFSPTAAKLVVAQARFESADYSSNVFKNNLNTSGMKYIGQPLATRGTPAPKNEQKCNGGCDSDYYAKFASVGDSAKDKIVRLYNITMRGVTPEQLKNSKNAEEFASLLKKRGYYGAPESQYANGLRAKLLRVQVVEFVSKNKNVLLIGLGLLAIGASYYLFTKNK